MFNLSPKLVLLSLWKKEAIWIALEIHSKEINLHSNYVIFHDSMIQIPKKDLKPPDLQDSLWH